MRSKRLTWILWRPLIALATVLAAGMVFLLLAAVRPPAATAQGAEVASPSHLPSGVSGVASDGEAFTISPNPPMAQEPTELRVTLSNISDTEIVLYTQFTWSRIGIGILHEPIGGRLPLVLPPHTLGFAKVVWAPPDFGPFCFFAEVFETPEAPGPVMAFEHCVFMQAYPDPGGGIFTEAMLFPVRNPLEVPADINLEVHVPVSATGWAARVYPAQFGLAAGESISATLMLTYTQGFPPNGTEVFDIFGFANGQPIGHFAKVFGAPLSLHTRPEPIYAESEISVYPYPIPPGEAAEICAEVRNVTRQPREALVHFHAAPFGIGNIYEPVAPPVPIVIPELGIQRACVHWVAPDGGQFSFEVLVETPGFPLPIISRRVLDVSELLLPGTTSNLTFPVHNPFPQPATVTLAINSFFPAWEITLNPSPVLELAPFETRPVTLTVVIPPGFPMPDDEAPVVDVQASIGLDMIGGFRKIYRPPVPIHRPGEPFYAESEIRINPYPPREREPTEICVELRNPTPVDQSMFLDINWADFGIGMIWHPINTLGPIIVPGEGIATPCIVWIPPAGGLYGIEVAVHLPGMERTFISQRVIDVGEILLPNEPAIFEFPVRNPFTETIIVNMGVIRYLPQWEVSFEPYQFQLNPGQVQPVILHILPVQRPGDPEPYEGMPIIDVEAWWDNGEAHGLLGGFRKLFFPPIPAHRPQDPIYAESEIRIIPYPPLAGEPTEITVEIRNPTDAPQTITVTIEVGSLGIGLPFSPINMETRTLPPGSVQVVGVIWVPPSAGEFCVRVQLETASHDPVYSARNLSIVRLPEPYGTPEVFQFPVGSGGIVTRPLTITLGLKEYLPNWHVELAQNEIVIQPGQDFALAEMILTPPANPDELPIDGGPIVDVEGYVDGMLIGGIRKVWRPPVPLGYPDEPTYAESEIVIDPYPPVAGQATTFGAQVRNNTDYTQTIHIQFGWADFGFGIPFSTTNVAPTQTVVVLGPFMTTTVATQWTPLYSGDICVQIILMEEMTGLEQHSQRNVHVVELPPEMCEPFSVDFWLQNPTPLTVTVELGSNTINLPPGWEYSVSPTETILGPFTGITVTLLITPVCELTTQGFNTLAATEDPGGAAKIQVEGYDENGALIGGVEIQLVTATQPRVYLPLIMRNDTGNLATPLPVTATPSTPWLPKWVWAMILLLGSVGAYLRRSELL